MLESGQLLCDRYRLTELLGQAPGRQTWLAMDQAAAIPEPVVVKLLAFGDQMEWVDLKLFEREAQVLQQLRHAYMPRYRDSFTLEDRLHWFGLVQDYIPGQSLKRCLDQGQHFSERQILDIATNILHLLTYLHGLSPPVLHRDIKPSNLVLGEDGYVYLIDFGAVQDRAAVEGASFTVVGSYGYTPMEQFGGRAVPASDLYALGATLIHLLTGVAPRDLPQEDLRIQFADRVSVSHGLVRWIQYLTEPDVKKRLQTADVALAALCQYPTEPKPPPTDMANRPLLNASAAAIVLEPPAKNRIKVQDMGDNLMLQIPGSKRCSEFMMLIVALLLLTIFFSYLGWPYLLLLLGVDVTAVIAFLYQATKPIMVQLTGENFALSKTVLSKPLILRRGKVQDIEDVCLLNTLSDRWANRKRARQKKAMVSRSVMLQTVTGEVYLGGRLLQDEARWLVALLRAWLAEHR